MESKQQEQSKNTFTLQQFIKAYTKIQDYAHLRSRPQQKSETSKESQQDHHLYKLFLIFGTTPSGKTLAQYYLCEDQLKYQIQEKTKLPYIIPETQFQKAFINTKPVSITTRIPNIRVRDFQGQKVIFVQIPDVKQLNLSQKSVQYAFLQHLFTTFNRIHFLLVISHQNLQNADDMIKQVECVTSLFDIKNQSSKQLFSSYLSVIVNKVPAEDQSQAILQTLKQIIQDQILQQNQTIGEILSKIIQNDRVYFIKSQTPLKQEQQQLFQKIIQQSKFTTFKDQSIQLEELIQLAEDQNIIEQMIQKQGIREVWKQGCIRFKQIVTYLLNDKRNQENHEQILSRIKQSHLDWLGAQQAGQKGSLHSQQAGGQKGSLNTKQAEQKVQPNKLFSKLPPSIIGSIESCLKNLTKANLPSQIHLRIQLSNPLFGDIKTQLENIIRCQFLKNNPKNQQIDQISQVHHENIQLKYFYYICNLFQCTIRYIQNILNYNPELSSSHLEFKESIVKLDQQLLEISRNQMQGLDMAMFQVKNKLNKKDKSNKIKNNRHNQRTVVQATLFDLRSFFIKTINNDITKDTLTQIFSLPNTAFKLLLLIQQYKKDEQFKDFLKMSAIVRQICKILDMNKLYIEQIPFWAAIADWNTTEEVLTKIEQEISMNRYRFNQNEETIQILGKLKHLLNQRKRRKLEGKCGDLIGKILEKMRQQDFSYEYKSENETTLSYKDYVRQLIAEPYLNETNCQSALIGKNPILVQKVITRQKQLQTQNNLINQFQYLMSQDLLVSNKSH